MGTHVQSVVFIPDLRMMLMLKMMLRVRIITMRRRIMVTIMKRGHYKVIMMRMILTRMRIL